MASKRGWQKRRRTSRLMSVPKYLLGPMIEKQKRFSANTIEALEIATLTQQTSFQLP